MVYMENLCSGTKQRGVLEGGFCKNVLVLLGQISLGILIFLGCDARFSRNPLAIKPFPWFLMYVLAEWPIQNGVRFLWGWMDYTGF